MREGYCQKRVYDGWRGSQCSRKAVVDGMWCKQHSPAAVAERERRREERYLEWQREHHAKRRPGRVLKFFEDAVRAIAAGHNDPAARAREAIRHAEEADRRSDPDAKNQNKDN